MPEDFAQDPANAEGASEPNDSDATGGAYATEAPANPLDAPGTDAELDQELADLNAAINK